MTIQAGSFLGIYTNQSNMFIFPTFIAGEFTNYKSKYQTEEFQFGMSFSEPEPEQKKDDTKEEEFDPENMDLRPADEDSTINYTDSSISDMLF